MRFDFPTIMVLLVFGCGAIWLLDAVLLAPRRRAAAGHAGSLDGDGDGEGISSEPAMPKVVEYARSFFPVFLIVLILRSFLVEPFRIPSGSMMPTLLIGDFILVNKFKYGIRLPVTDQKIVELGVPDRGDVVVFRYPEDPSIPFIKRIVGLPGDRIAYRDKAVFVNDVRAEQTYLESYVGAGSGSKFNGIDRLREDLIGHEHGILLNPRARFGREDEWQVPVGHYFVLGDNRDHSEDSRYWGFVPDENLIGNAFMIWMSWDWGHGGPKWQRIGDAIE